MFTGSEKKVRIAANQMKKYIKTNLAPKRFNPKKDIEPEPDLPQKPPRKQEKKNTIRVKITLIFFLLLSMCKPSLIFLNYSLFCGEKSEYLNIKNQQSKSQERDQPDNFL